MNNDDDWVADVRRWYFGGTEPAGDGFGDFSEGASTYEAALGYEAAHPHLQSPYWPDAPTVHVGGDPEGDAPDAAPRPDHAPR